MIKEKLIELSCNYSRKVRSNDEIKGFCVQYDVIYSNFFKELEVECNPKLFALLEEIYMLCDAYEHDNNILSNEPYCIDYKKLQRELKKKVSRIEQLGYLFSKRRKI